MFDVSTLVMIKMALFYKRVLFRLIPLLVFVSLFGFLDKFFFISYFSGADK